MVVSVTLNGVPSAIDAPEAMPLLWVLRDVVGVRGTKYGCGAALCGACTVMLNGQPARSCVTPLGEAAGGEVRTIEGLGATAIGRALQDAWLAAQVPQCGYCQSGMLVAAAALLQATPRPTDADIDDAMTNLCRCGTYARIRRAIHAAASRLAGVAGQDGG